MIVLKPVSEVNRRYSNVVVANKSEVELKREESAPNLSSGHNPYLITSTKQPNTRVSESVEMKTGRSDLRIKIRKKQRPTELPSIETTKRVYQVPADTKATG